MNSYYINLKDTPIFFLRLKIGFDSIAFEFTGKAAQRLPQPVVAI